MVRILALGGPVGDEPDAGEFWTEFASGGVDLEIADNLNDCLSQLGRGDFHAVVLDLTASGRSLPELARLKQSYAQLPIFVLVDATDGSVGQWVTRHGAAACLDVKYYDASATRSIIENVVRKSASED